MPRPLSLLLALLPFFLGSSAAKAARRRRSNIHQQAQFHQQARLE